MATDLFQDADFSHLSGNASSAPVDLLKDPDFSTQPPMSAGDSIKNFFSQAYQGGKRDIQDVAAGLGQYSLNASNFITGNNSNYDVAKQSFGITDPNWLDQGLQGLGQAAPYIAGGEGLLGARLAAQGLSKAPLLMRLGNSAITGGVYGGTQSPEGQRLTGAAEGAAAFPALEAAGMGIGKGAQATTLIPQAAKNYLSKYAASGLSNDVSQGLNPSGSISNETAFDLAKSNLQSNYLPTERNAWDKVTSDAANADTSGAKFDDSSYTKALSDERDRLKTQSENQGGYRRQNKDAIELIEGKSEEPGYLDDQHSTFSDAIDHNKSLNADYQNEITPGKSLPFSTVNFAKDQIKQAFQDNLAKNGLQDTLGKSWQDANQATINKNQIFNDLISSKGKDQYSSFSSFLNGKSPFAERGTFVTDYLPKPGTQGTQRMQQFASMLGDDNTAKSVLKNNYFGSEFEPSSFLSKYNRLSDDQKSYLFNTDQKSTVDALSNVLSSHPDALKNSTFQSFWNHSIPTILGGAAGHALGGSTTEGMLGGLAAGHALNTGLSKAFENPSVQNYFTNYLNSPQRKVSMDYLSKLLGKGIPATIAPSLNKRSSP